MAVIHAGFSRAIIAAVGVTLFLSGSALGGPTIRYVDNSEFNTAPGDGTSWAMAYDTLQDALDEANAPMSGVTEIRVAQGTYLPDAGANVNDDDRAATFIVGGFTVRGGFKGLADRLDPDGDAKLPTILSGDLMSNDMPGLGDPGDNSLHIVTVVAGIDEVAVLDRVTISGGNADGAAPHDRGGGVLAESASVMLSNSILSGNVALLGAGVYCAASVVTLDACLLDANEASARGGAVMSVASSLDLSSCQVMSNTAGADGGGLLLEEFSDASLSGCEITNNLATIRGGGIYSMRSDSVLDDCSLSGNMASLGGGLYNFDSDAILVNATVLDQNEAASGGAMYNAVGSDAVLNGVSLTGNTATDGPGGAIYNATSSPSVTDSTFVANQATSFGGACHNTNQSDPAFTGCVFMQNSAGLEGGALYSTMSSPSMSGCTFDGNGAMLLGGAVSAHGASASASTTVDGCEFTANASGIGGAYFIDAASTTFTSCLFTGNTATTRGGALDASDATVGLVNCELSGNSTSGDGGAVNALGSSDVSVVNCTFSGNSAENAGGAIHASASTVTVDNSILWGDTPDELSGDTATVMYSDVQGGAAGTANIDEDPLFTDAAGGDLRLMATSPCIDAGENDLVPSGVTTDRAGNDRIVDGDGDAVAVVDMGAYESPAVVDDCPADLNGNGAVDFQDLVQLLSAWSPEPDSCTDCPEDLDGDGDVDFQDLVLLLAAYGPCPQ